MLRHLRPDELAAALLGEAGEGNCLEQTDHGPDTLANPEPGFFILGAQSFGRNSQFLLRIGWQQVNDVFDSLLPQAAATRALRPCARRCDGG